MTDLDDREALEVDGAGIATIPCWAITNDQAQSLFRDLDLCWDY
jgi:hypothetical protein